jgi:hypothetical protein
MEINGNEEVMLKWSGAIIATVPISPANALPHSHRCREGGLPSLQGTSGVINGEKSRGGIISC